MFNIRSDFENVPCSSLRTCCDLENIIEKRPLQEKVTKGSGERNIHGLGGKSIGSHSETLFGEFPWMMAIVKKQKVGDFSMNIFVSGGSLIHPSVVLTSAHNFQNLEAEMLTVRGGEWNALSAEEILKHEDRNVHRIVLHPDFNPDNLFNDVAVLLLETPFKIAAHINTICLPEPDYLQQGCLTTGWGKDKFGNRGEYQAFLRKVELPLVTRETCEKLLRKTRLGEDFLLHESFICAGERNAFRADLKNEMFFISILGGEENVDACTGDGGSPFVCPNPNKPNHFYQIGIVSWGISCYQKDVPGVYVDVSKFKPWIEEQMQSLQQYVNSNILDTMVRSGNKTDN